MTRPAARFFSFACLAMFWALVFPAGAQNAASDSPPAISPATRLVSQRLLAEQSLERHLEVWRNEFRNADADMNGVVDQADVDLHEVAAAAMMRASLVPLMLRADLDGDGAATEDELRRVLKYNSRLNAMARGNPSYEQNVEAEVQKLKSMDANGDGKVTLAEMVASMQLTREARGHIAHVGQQTKVLMTFGPEGKNSVTLADIEPVVESLFHTVDVNSDNKLSQDEIKAYRMQPNQPGGQARIASERAMREREQTRLKAEAERLRKEEAANAACAMPKASEQAKVIMVGAYQTQALSTTTIGYQDVSVGVGNVTVEPGSEPIYLVVTTFRPTIWRFFGAVERLERVVLTSTMTGGGRGMPDEKPLVGATGLPSERVTFLGQSKCLSYFSETPSSQAAMASAAVRRQAGKEVQAIASNYGMSGFRVPSGQIESVRDENSDKLIIVKPSGSLRVEGDASNYIVQAGPGNVIGDLRRYHPNGVIAIDPAKVVSSLPAEPYEVLPQEAGLLQLVQAGAMERNRSGEYMIKKKMRFPAELHGAHSVKFLLLRGVPLPEGDPGHSDVVSEETGEKLKFRKRG